MQHAPQTRSGGICVAASTETSTAAAVRDLASQVGDAEFHHVMVLFSIEHDPHELNQVLAETFPDVEISGSSTSGEISPRGMIDGGIVLIGFPEHHFHVETECIEDIEQFGVERADKIVRDLKSRIMNGRTREECNKFFAILLVDGLSNCEEMLIAAVHWAIGDVQLAGGSSGDNLRFKQSALLHRGRVLTNAAILIMVETDLPFTVFKSQNFEPTATKLVVTSADCEKRIVHELNAEPAAREYAAAIGLSPDDLGPFSFASYPLVVKVGGDYYCRSIRNMNDDGSLSFFCAIDEGLVLTVARPKDLISATEGAFEEIDRELGGIQGVLAFDCILRRLDAEAQQIRRQLDDLYQRYHLFGFHTYGEQYNSMHLNQTLTGIAFGDPTNNESDGATPEAIGVAQ